MKFDLCNNNFNYFEEFGVKIIYKEQVFFKENKKYKLEKKEENKNTREKYILYVEKNISELELTEILFSLQKELNLEKYDLLEDFIGKIKIYVQYLINNGTNKEKIEQKYKTKGISEEYIENIKKYKIKNLFEFRKFIKKLKDKQKNEKGLEKHDLLLEELYKTFYNTIFHIGIEYQKNHIKNYTKKDFDELLSRYNIYIPSISENFIENKSKKEKIPKTKVALTLKDRDFYLEKEEKLKDLLKLEERKKKILELIEKNELTEKLLFKYLEAFNYFIYQYPSIYEESGNGEEGKIVDKNFIDITEEKKIMCLTKSTLLYGFLSELPEFNIKTNLEPHHITSDVYIRGEEYYLDPTIFDEPKISKYNGSNTGKFKNIEISNLSGELQRFSTKITGKSKDILFSAYLSNLIYSISNNKDFKEEDLEILERLFKYSIMGQKNSYISYRALGVGYSKIYKEINDDFSKNKALEKFKETLNIYHIDSPAWAEIGKIIGGKNKYIYIYFILSNFNGKKLNGRQKYLYEKKNYEKFGLKDEDIDKIKEILKDKKFYKLLDFIDF